MAVRTIATIYNSWKLLKNFIGPPKVTKIDQSNPIAVLDQNRIDVDGVFNGKINKSPQFSKLSKAQQDKLIGDLAHDPDGRLKAAMAKEPGGAELIDVWKGIDSHPELRVNPEILTKLSKLDTDALANFDLDLKNATNGSLKAHFIQRPELVDSWSILFKESDEISAVLRKRPENLQNPNDYIVAEGADLTKLKNTFKNTAYPEKWLELKIPKNKLDETFSSLKNDPPANIDPWTPEHKAQRWNNYKEGDGTLDFESWSNGYDGNINKAVKGNKKVKDYASNNSLDIPESGFERTWPDDLTIELRGQNVTGKRRHDIYDVDNRKAIEVKDYRTQNVSKSVDIEREALMDIKLLQQDRVSEIEWVFLGNGPSGPLRELLIEGGIKIIP